VSLVAPQPTGRSVADEDAGALLLRAEAQREAVQLTIAYVTELDRVASQIGDMVRGVFQNLESIDRSEIERFIALAEPYTGAGQAEGADLAAAYLSELTGQSLSAAQVTFPTIDYSGPFQRTWHNLKEMTPYDEARAGGDSVAEMLGYDSVNDGASARMARPGIQVAGYRRVISAKACEWCRVVATQLYTSAETATFGHHGCKCTVLAVMRDTDPTKAINQARLRELKASGAVGRVSEARERSRERQRNR
jgi:hypothetical protein